MPDTQAVVSVTTDQSVVEVLAPFVPGLGTSRAIVESRQTITENHTITNGWNGISLGPVTIADGVIVTVPENSVWQVI